MRKVFIYDNDSSTISSFKKYLEEDNYVIYDSLSISGNLIESVKTIHPDLVILNAEVNGIDVLISDEQTRNIPVLFLFEKNKYEQIFSPEYSHLYSYSKPFNRKKLIDVIEKAISERNIIPSVNESFSLSEKIISEAGTEVYDYLHQFAEIYHPCTFILKTTSGFNLRLFQHQQIQKLINLKRLNDIRYLNKFIENVNHILPMGGLFIGCAETKDQRKTRILRKFPPVLNYFYYSADFVLKRLFPKLKITRKIYFLITEGRNRVLSRAEVLGRLYSCGFEYVDGQFINNRYYFVGKKIKAPTYDPHPSYGLLIKMKRVGKGGSLIDIFKFRTMHPFSEYIQDFIYKKNNLAESGKFQDDFRITTVGKIFRKFWLDELPMIINLIKGDIKLVGVRPLSQQYFNLYPEEFREFRIKFKPGLIPPYYVDMPDSFIDIVLSEKKYLDEYSKQPFRTDVKYFFKAIFNILIKRARSS